MTPEEQAKPVSMEEIAAEAARDYASVFPPLDRLLASLDSAFAVGLPGVGLPAIQAFEAAARADERARVLAEVERALLADGFYDFDSVQEILAELKTPAVST